MCVSNKSQVLPLLPLTGGPHFENHSSCFTVSTSQTQQQSLVFSLVIFGVNVSGSTCCGAPRPPLSPGTHSPAAFPPAIASEHWVLGDLLRGPGHQEHQEHPQIIFLGSSEARRGFVFPASAHHEADAAATSMGVGWMSRCLSAWGQASKRINLLMHLLCSAGRKQETRGSPPGKSCWDQPAGYRLPSEARMLHWVLPTPSETSGLRNAQQGTMFTLTLLFFHSTNICLSFCVGLWVRSWDLNPFHQDLHSLG